MAFTIPIVLSWVHVVHFFEVAMAAERGTTIFMSRISFVGEDENYSSSQFLFFY